MNKKPKTPSLKNSPAPASDFTTVSLDIPNSTLAQIDIQAAQENLTRANYILTLLHRIANNPDRFAQFNIPTQRNRFLKI